MVGDGPRGGRVCRARRVTLDHARPGKPRPVEAVTPELSSAPGRDDLTSYSPDRPP